MPTQTTSKSLWITTVEARERLELNRHQFWKLMQKEVLTVRRMPGVRVKVLASDVDRLVAESVEPAKARV